MSCRHLTGAGTAPPEVTGYCPQCRELGSTEWVHLRSCLTCGQVGCCDSSPYRHASDHFAQSGHPVIRSVQPGESWRWCYLDEEVG